MRYFATVISAPAAQGGPLMARDERTQQQAERAGDLREQREPQLQRSTSPSQEGAGGRDSAASGLVVPASTLANLAVHSLLMVTLPFVAFFASHLGGLDGI